MSDSKSSPFPNHRGKATWGDRVVEMSAFDAEVERHGRQLDEAGRVAAERSWAQRELDPTPVEGPFRRVLVFGGIYSNAFALRSLLQEAQAKRVDAIYCLGDLGGFGPQPEAIWPLLTAAGVRVIQGNYEQSLSSGAEDCNCGYTDPRDNHFAALSYEYTERHCSAEFKSWMGQLPARRRLKLGGSEWLLIHGSPRQVNEFLFDSATPDGFLERLLDEERCDGILCTHSGLHWQRRLPSGRQVVNVGVIGRPANDGRRCVWYAMLEQDDARSDIDVQLLPLEYDYVALAEAMRRERLPQEFIETIETGWWTTCLEILPTQERERSRY